MQGEEVMLRSRVLGAAALAAVSTLLTATSAQAAGKPVVSTGAAADVAQQTVTLTGTVAPNGSPATSFFQYGPSKLYGATTAATPTPTKLRLTAPVSGLAPATVYHYRLVAQNAHGTTTGKDRVFTTRRQPLAVTLGAAPNPVLFGSGTTLAGALTGTGNANRALVLQANP